MTILAAIVGRARLRSVHVPPAAWSTVGVFYVIIFGALAVLLVAAGVTAMARQRRRFRDAGIDDTTPDAEERDP
jgi:hypothetical protein